MAVISIGLAESIREWFSAGVDVTSVESSAPVDLATVKKHRTRRKIAGKDEALTTESEEDLPIEATDPDAPVPTISIVHEPEEPPVLDEPPAEEEDVLVEDSKPVEIVVPQPIAAEASPVIPPAPVTPAPAPAI